MLVDPSAFNALTDSFHQASPTWPLARHRRGMKPRASLLVVMRKLMVMANAIIRDGEAFRADHVPEAPAAA